jgi:hypothetical protein
MRALVMLFLFFGSIAVAGPLDLGTFAVTGGGSFNCAFWDSSSGFTFSFSGSNANYMLNVSSGMGLYGPQTSFPCGSYVGQNAFLADTYPPSYDSIELIGATFWPAGLTSETTFSGAVTFQLGNGTGYVDIYNNPDQGNLLATASLVGYVTVTSVQPVTPIYPTFAGTFGITPEPPGDPVPEPGCAVLVLAGALGLRSYFAFARG